MRLSSEEIQILIKRIYKLEQEVADLRAEMGLAPRVVEPAVLTPTPDSLDEEPAFPAPEPAAVAASPRTIAISDEANLVGTWLARAGALAVLIGAAFAFKYAVDHGIIGPAARVAIGLAVALGFMVTGETGRRKGWLLFSQAMAGGGIALAYLSILAGLHLYRLYGPGATFAALVTLTGLGVGLAIHHESSGLILLSTAGGFLNPFLLGETGSSHLTLYLYALALDFAVLGLSFKRWPWLDAVAFAGTQLILIAPNQTSGRSGLEATFISIFFIMFGALPFVRSVLREGTTGEGDVAIQVANAGFFYGHAYSLLGPHESVRGLFTLLMAGVYLASGWWARSRGDERLTLTGFGLCAAFVTTWMVTNLHDQTLVTGFAAEGVVLLYLTRDSSHKAGRLLGQALIAISVFGTTTMLSSEYRPALLLFSRRSAEVLIEILLLYAAGWILSPLEDPSSTAARIAASLITVGWLSVEAVRQVERSVPQANVSQASQFTVTATWGLYAGALLAVGVRFRLRWARLLAAGLFAFVALKMLVADLWLMKLAYRVIAFVGLGVLMLISSVMYQRLRDLVIGEDTDELAVSAKGGDD